MTIPRQNRQIRFQHLHKRIRNAVENTATHAERSMYTLHVPKPFTADCEELDFVHDFGTFKNPLTPEKFIGHDNRT